MLNEYKQESLRDLITRSRNSNNISVIINSALNTIKKEMQSSDKNTKTHAVLKLMFLYLNNHNIKWAILNTMEVITTCGIKGKRIGYLLAQFQFKNNQEWIFMLPNLIRKDLQSNNNNVISMSLDLVNSIMNPQMANEICKDLEKLLNLNNSNIRKKLVISLTKAAEMLLKSKINENFWDDFLVKMITLLNNHQNTSNSNTILICVISCIQKVCKSFPQKTITIFIELMNYFSKCEVNWNIIKIIDIFSDLLKFEPRLAKKREFVKLISDKLAVTTSKSVEIQLVKLVINNYDSNINNNLQNISNNTSSELFFNCEERLKCLLYFNDNNLVLVALRILRDFFNKNRVISNNYLNDLIKIVENSNCKTLQEECLDIIYLCVTKQNYKAIVEKLLNIIIVLGNKAINTILNICIFDNYSRLETKEDFIWFLNILFDLGKNEFLKNELKDSLENVNNNSSNSNEEMKISHTIRDISQRIIILREYILHKSLDISIFLFSNIKSNEIINSGMLKYI